MREHDVGDVGDGFFALGVLGVDVVEEADAALGLGGAEVVLDDDAGAGAVDEGGAAFHAREEGAADEPAGFVVFGDVEGDGVGFLEEFGERDERDAQLGGLVGGKEGVVAEEFGVEAGEALGDEAADVAQAHDADGLAGELGAHEILLFPAAGAAGGVGGDDVAVVGEEERDDFLGDGVGVGAGGVHDVNAFLAGVADVDGVVAGAGSDDDAEGGGGVDEGGVDFFAADDEGVGVGVVLEDLGEVATGELDDGIAAVGFEKLLGDGVEGGGDDDFFHGADLGLLNRF